VTSTTSGERIPVGRSERLERACVGRSDDSLREARSERGRSWRLVAGAESPLPVKNPKIRARMDFFAAGLFSCVLDDDGRFPRPGRRDPPLREERPCPLGVYSDDICILTALLCWRAERG